MSKVVPLRLRDGSRHAAPQVFDHLREQIVSLALAPGTVLSRAELQDQFRLSSTPIRDALMRLRDETLVDIFPQHATVVSPIDLTAARQAQFLRRSIEQEAVRVLAETSDPALVQRLQAIIDRQQAMAELGDLELFNGADHDFHRAIYEAAGIPDLWALVRRHSGHIDRLRRLHLPMEGKAQQILIDHREILSAIIAADPDLAQTRARDHLSRSLAYISEIRARYPDYFRD